MSSDFGLAGYFKDYFNRVIARKNKSALVTKPMQEGIARVEHKAQSDADLMRILAARQQALETSTETILQTRDALRAESDCAHDLPQR